MAEFGWRSLLYVPAHQERLVAGAHERGADAIILDLEDGVPPEAKEAARQALQAAAPQVSAGGADALVRINKPWPLAWRDLEAAVEAGAEAVLLPKVEDACRVSSVAEHLDDLEATSSGRPMRLLALIESASGLANLRDIAGASPRLHALIPGNEDLAADLGIEPTSERMLPLFVPLLLAARAAGLRVYGTFGGSADFRDLAAYRERARLSKSWGFDGATCIHPSQVRVINEVYAPSAADLERAERVTEAFEAALGNPVALDGAMVDRPVYLRAKRMLEQKPPNPASRLPSPPASEGDDEG